MHLRDITDSAGERLGCYLGNSAVALKLWCTGVEGGWYDVNW